MLKLCLGLLIAGLSASANSTCDWSNPGQDPYTGRPDTAVHAFKDLPWLARHLLSQRVGRSAPDDLIDIGKTEIKGSRWTYANEIHNMHFGGAGRVCPSISRAGWTQGHTEPAAVWCTKLPFSAARNCVARAKVCGNFFQVTQVGAAWSPGGGRVNHTPEPGTLTLVGGALLGLLLLKK